MELVTAGRTDLEDYFRLSGALDFSKLNHTPFLAFVPTEVGFEVRVVKSIRELLKLPDDVKVMAQWRGEWSSDFFQFTVGDARAAYDVKVAITPPPAKPRYVETTPFSELIGKLGQR